MWPVEQLIKGHSALAAKLARFAYPDAARLVAALAVGPEVHANAFRINVLAHLIAVICRGKVTPTGIHLVEWCRLLYESELRRHEDPIEDVFVGCVNSESGSFRVFVGNTSDGDFWAERLLAFLEGKREFPTFDETYRSAIALLRLCDCVAGRLDLIRYQAGGGEAAGRIHVPARDEIAAGMAGVDFSAEELRRLEIPLEALTPFLLSDDHRAKLAQETMGNSELERQPLLKTATGVTLIAPMFVAQAVQRLILSRVASSMGGWADTFFAMESASTFVNEIAKRLGVRAIEFEAPAPPKNLPPLYPFFADFDLGKPAILLTYCPPITEVATDYGGQDAWDQSTTQALLEYVDACAEKFEQIPGFTGGMVLINLVTIRWMAFGLPAIRKNWQIHAASLADWLLLTQAECTAMRLWKLGEQTDRLHEAGTRIMNLAGLLNQYAYWKSGEFRMVRQDMSPKTSMVNLDCDFSAKLRTETLQQQDEHCVLAHDRASWVRVVRHTARAFLDEDKAAPIYADYAAGARHRFVGCVEADTTRWWLSASFAGLDDEKRDLVHQIWRCLLNWIDPFSRVVAETWRAFGHESVAIDLVLPDLPGWKFDRSQLPELVTAPQLDANVDRAASKLTLNIPTDFLTAFAVPKNVAEAEIVAAMVRGAAALHGMELTPTDCAALVRAIVRSDDARYFHMTAAQGIEQLLAGPGHPDPVFVADEDLAAARFGLADLAGRPKSDRVEGREACQKFLQAIVEKVWERMEARLRPFHHTTVVGTCCAALDEVERDRSHWDLTARSLLAMHRDTAGVYDLIHDRRSDRAKSSLGNRLLIETSQYACAGDRPLNRADHMALLADMAVLLELAHHRDAIAFGFLDPVVTIFANGEIGVDESFYRDVVGKYFTQQSLERTERAAASYEDHYPQASSETAPVTPDPRLETLNSVMLPEFGFSCDHLLDVTAKFHDLATYGQQAGGIFSEPEFRVFLKHCGLKDDNATAFLDRMTLPVRTAWNKDLPIGAHERDVYPWRFRRQLSALVRPLIQVTTDPRSWFVSVPLLTQSTEYLLGNIERAYFPNSVFRSNEMRQFVGKIVHERGHAFAAKAAEVFRSAGYQTKLEVELTSLGASKKDGLGDVDVLSWDANLGRVYAAECKRLRTAATIREVVQRLEEFKGSREEKDALFRHTRRIEWLKGHLPALSKLTGIPVDKIKLCPLLITSEGVPMQFFQALQVPTNQVVSFGDLAKLVAK